MVTYLQLWYCSNQAAYVHKVPPAARRRPLQDSRAAGQKLQYSWPEQRAEHEQARPSLTTSGPHMSNPLQTTNSICHHMEY